MQIETAIIPVAGAGTSVFPCTTAIDKCFMPVYANGQSRPLIDFMVEDCAGAGLKRVIFVTTERGKAQLKEYFEDLNPILREQLSALGRDDLIAAELQRRHSYNLQYEYVIQPPNIYGTAVPPYLAREALSGEKHFALMGGDDFVYHTDGTSELKLAIDTWQSSNTDHVIMGVPVAREQAPRYGILQIDASNRLVSIDEKPPLERVPENPIANISRYLLNDQIWDEIAAEVAIDRGKGREHYITNPISQAVADGQSFQVHAVTGTYFNGGNFDGLLEASNYLKAHPRT
jgi:UTP-glucose-1-phosphate uridylyltransferase